MKWNSPRKFFPPQVRAIRQSGEGIGKIESAWKPRTQKLGKSLLPGDIDRRTTFTKGECLSTLFSPFIRVRGQAFENRERYIRPQRVCTYTCIESRCIRHAALLILVALLACLLREQRNLLLFNGSNSVVERTLIFFSSPRPTSPLLIDRRSRRLTINSIDRFRFRGRFDRGWKIGAAQFLRNWGNVLCSNLQFAFGVKFLLNGI